MKLIKIIFVLLLIAAAAGYAMKRLRDKTQVAKPSNVQSVVAHESPAAGLVAPVNAAPAKSQPVAAASVVASSVEVVRTAAASAVASVRPAASPTALQRVLEYENPAQKPVLTGTENSPPVAKGPYLSRVLSADDTSPLR